MLNTADGGLDALARCAVVIKTPGISPYGPQADQLRAAGVTLVGGLGLWLNEADLDRVVCVTGTKGKSTTSSVIGHLLRGLGRKAMVGGNFGAAPYDPDQAGDYDYWVIEVSSYTATDLAVTPPVTAVTSLHPDHLPWHGDVERYYRDKLSATSQPGAEPHRRQRRQRAAPRAGRPARPRGRVGHRVRRPRRDLDGPPGPARQAQPPQRADRPAVLRALGPAAADQDLVRQAADDAGARAPPPASAPLPSRLTPIGAVDGVTFIDDSLSTNVLPTLAALDSFPARRVALIVGGQDRGIDYAPLAEAVRGEEPTLVLTLPDSGPRISAAFAATRAPAGRRASDIDGLPRPGGRRRRRASRWARPDGIVLLSPAAPSFGHFRDYRDRGDHFAAAMRALGHDRRR